MARILRSNMQYPLIRVVATNHGVEYHDSMAEATYCTTDPWIECHNDIFIIAVAIAYPDNPEIEKGAYHLTFRADDIHISFDGRMISMNNLPESGYPESDTKGQSGHWKDLLAYIFKYKDVKITGFTNFRLIHTGKEEDMATIMLGSIEIISDKSYADQCAICHVPHEYPKPLDRYLSIEKMDPFFPGMKTYIDGFYAMLGLTWGSNGSKGYSKTFFNKPTSGPRAHK